MPLSSSLMTTLGAAGCCGAMVSLRDSVFNVKPTTEHQTSYLYTMHLVGVHVAWPPNAQRLAPEAHLPHTVCGTPNPILSYLVFLSDPIWF
jgi:hypothetical protein